MSAIEFKAPGPGSWELEQTHFAKPATRYASTILSDLLPAASGKAPSGSACSSTRFGCGSSTISATASSCRSARRTARRGRRPCTVHAGHPPAPRDSAQDGSRAGSLFKEALARRHAAVGRGNQTRLIKRNRALQTTLIAKLDEAAFLAYLEKVRDNAVE